MQLFLLRHAEAESHSENDEERALTDKGRRQAANIGRFCAAHDIAPDVILSSPLVRARETAEAVAHELGMPKRVQIEEFLGVGMTPESSVSGLEKYSGRESVMLVGHEPDFSRLAGALIGGHRGSVRFRKATLLSISLQNLKPGAGTIEFLIPVKCL
ncbi:MAG TPA: phosphohistidine phosphatase SixA [Chthoniobacterales bacterium]|nr:phosphohistidine phosphatase SixA [Chthoniobacterales bacterium]